MIQENRGAQSRESCYPASETFPVSFNMDEYPYQHIFERDKFTCQYCGWQGSDNFESWYIAALCIDHILPQYAGGTESDSNLVVSCRSCKEIKGKLIPTSFEHARQVVDQKQAEARAWFERHLGDHHT